MRIASSLYNHRLQFTLNQALTSHVQSSDLTVQISLFTRPI